MGKTKLIVLIVLMLSGVTQAQVNRYMVFFKDKTGTPFSIAAPENFLSQRALARRTSQNIEVIAEDLPVTPTYVDQVSNTGAKVLYRTKWMNGVLVECTGAQATTIEALSIVQDVEFVAPNARPAGGRTRASGKFKSTEGMAAATDTQLAMIGIDNLHDGGYHGEGMLIAVLDAGFPGADTISLFDRIFDDERLDEATSYDFVSGGHQVFRHNNHGTHVWSIMAAYKKNVYVGGAYKANFILFVTEDAATEYRVEEYNWLFAAERADSAGVDVINTSLGYRDFDNSEMDYVVSDMDGQTAVITRAAEIASSKGIAVIVSAGNEGHNQATTIGAPADGESVLAVGSVTSNRIKSSFSSIGPSADGRIKPDISAMGTGVSFVNTSGVISTGNGTSYAAPLMASLTALVWQRQPTLTVHALLDSIRKHGHLYNSPDNQLGYGIPDFNYLVTGVEPKLEKLISVFPNPTTSRLKIELPADLLINDLKFNLLDSKGAAQAVRVLPVSDRELWIDLSNQKPGLYILRCQRGNQHSVHKILKVD
jgi:serine protease AprX